MRPTTFQTRLRRTYPALLAAAVATAGAAFATVLAADSHAQAPVRPSNTVRPTISGTPANGMTLQANRGTWRGTPAPTFTFQWLRCNAQAEGCVTIPGATAATYTATGLDVARTLRVRVTGRNSAGSSGATSNATVQVGAGSVVSIPASQVPREERLVVSDIRFSPNPVRSRNQVITARILVKDTRGLLVNGINVFMRATPRVTSGDTKLTGNDGWATLHFTPNQNFRFRSGHNIQFFIQAYRQGEPLLAGIAGFRLTQVRMGNR